jgi:hypothetical protein
MPRWETVRVVPSYIGWVKVTLRWGGGHSLQKKNSFVECTCEHKKVFLLPTKHYDNHC